MIRSDANATIPRIFPRKRGSGGGTYAGAAASGGGGISVWSQLQKGHAFADSSMERSQRIQVFRSLILLNSVQPAYRVIPDIDAARSYAKGLRCHRLGNYRALRLRETV